MSRVHAITAGAERIQFVIERSRRRTVGIAVAFDGAVRVRAPHRVSATDVLRLVRERADWIARKRIEAAARSPERRYANGQVHSYLGVGYRLRIARSESPSVALRGDEMVVAIPGDAAPAGVKTTLETWYLTEAKRILPGRLSACWRVFADSDEAPPPIRVRIMTSRWGSLTRAGRISLNARLMSASPACIDAVIYHELCHMRVRGHGPDFYRELARYVPEWQACRRELRSKLD